MWQTKYASAVPKNLWRRFPQQASAVRDISYANTGDKEFRGGVQNWKKNLCKGNTSFHLFSWSSFLTKSLKIKISHFLRASWCSITGKDSLNPPFENFKTGITILLVKDVKYNHLFTRHLHGQTCNYACIVVKITHE